MQSAQGLVVRKTYWRLATSSVMAAAGFRKFIADEIKKRDKLMPAVNIKAE
jgi:hypothetical protein